MGATTIFYFSCETNILHIISRFYAGIRVTENIKGFIRSVDITNIAYPYANTAALWLIPDRKIYTF